MTREKFLNIIGTSAVCVGVLSALINIDMIDNHDFITGGSYTGPHSMYENLDKLHTAVQRGLISNLVTIVSGFIITKNSKNI